MLKIYLGLVMLFVCILGNAQTKKNSKTVYNKKASVTKPSIESLNKNNTEVQNIDQKQSSSKPINKEKNDLEKELNNPYIFEGPILEKNNLTDAIDSLFEILELEKNFLEVTEKQLAFMKKNNTSNFPDKFFTSFQEEI